LQLTPDFVSEVKLLEMWHSAIKRKTQNNVSCCIQNTPKSCCFINLLFLQETDLLRLIMKLPLDKTSDLSFVGFLELVLSFGKNVLSEPNFHSLYTNNSEMVRLTCVRLFHALSLNQNFSMINN